MNEVLKARVVESIKVRVSRLRGWEVEGIAEQLDFDGLFLLSFAPKRDIRAKLEWAIPAKLHGVVYDQITDDVIDVLKAHLAEQPSNWISYETPPLHSRLVLCVNKGAPPFVGSYGVHTREWYDTTSAIRSPSHWQELPKGPK